jgi:hypothetical protein
MVLAWPATSVQAVAPASANAGSLCILVCDGSGAAPTPAPTQSSSGCLLGLVCVPANPAAGPTSSPPCVLGVLLCPNSLVAQPTPCVAGEVLCGPPPATPCIAAAVLCPGGVVTTPTATPPVNPPPGGSGPGTGPGTTGPGGGDSAPLGANAASISVAGVGLVPRLIDARSDNAAAIGIDPNPDAFTELLSLSIRDGLRVGGYQLWPLLAALQLILLVVVLGVFSARRLLRVSNLPAE